MQKLLISFSVVLCFSVLVGAIIFLKFSPVDQAEAAENTVTCQTTFPRPLIFGISSTGVQSGYGPPLLN